MTLIDKAVKANRDYAKSPDPNLNNRPVPKLAVVTCMDPPLSDLPAILGLPHADLDVIRTAGPAVTEDVISELITSNRVIGTTEIMILNHPGCGFTPFNDATSTISFPRKPAMTRRLRCDSSPSPIRSSTRV